MEISKIDHIKLQLWIETGKSDQTPADMIKYLDRLEMVRSLISKYESPAYITKILMKLDDGYSRTGAQLLIAESINFFYCSNDIKKEAWRNIYAERLDNAALVCWEDNDMDGYKRMIEAAMKARRLDQADKEDIPYDLLNQKTILYQLDPEKMGIKKVDRTLLAEFIDKLPLEEVQKSKLRSDGGIENVCWTEEDGTEQQS
ncbi:MAG: hypothetical protein WCO63_16620 [Bacteroidota bacterium]